MICFTVNYFIHASSVMLYLVIVHLNRTLTSSLCIYFLFEVQFQIQLKISKIKSTHFLTETLFFFFFWGGEGGGLHFTVALVSLYYSLVVSNFERFFLNESVIQCISYMIRRLIRYKSVGHSKQSTFYCDENQFILHFQIFLYLLLNSVFQQLFFIHHSRVTNRFHKFASSPNYMDPVYLAMESLCLADARINFP